MQHFSTESHIYVPCFLLWAISEETYITNPQILSFRLGVKRINKWNKWSKNCWTDIFKSGSERDSFQFCLLFQKSHGQRKESLVAPGHLQRGWQTKQLDQFRQYVFGCDNHLITGDSITTCVSTVSVSHSKLEKHRVGAIQWYTCLGSARVLTSVIHAHTQAESSGQTGILKTA